MKTEDIEALGR